MLLRLLSTFLVIQALSFGLWQTMQPASAEVQMSAAPETQAIVVDHQAASEKHSFDHLKFAARTKDDDFFLLDPVKRNSLIDVLKKLPNEHLSVLDNLVLDYDPKAHRGLGGKNIIIIRAVDMGPVEFTGVMIHEIGHTVDLGYLKEMNKLKPSEFKDGKKAVYEGDPSLDFYKISWENEKIRNKKANNLDFVSGYAMSDPFEDFAESYVYYVLHNKDFRSKTQTSDTLLQKYNFMKYVVFGGKEFETGKLLTEKLNNRPWDITVLSYDLNNFLNS